MMGKKLDWIRIIGRIVYLYGIIRITLAILNLVFIIPSTRFTSVGIDISSLYTIMFLGAGLGLICSIAYLISGVGILKLKRWAYILLINILIIQRLFDIFYIFCSVNYNISHTDFFVNLGLFAQGLNLILPFLVFHLLSFLFLLFNIAILIFVIYFFTRPKVKEQFK